MHMQLNTFGNNRVEFNHHHFTNERLAWQTVEQDQDLNEPSGAAAEKNAKSSAAAIRGRHRGPHAEGVTGVWGRTPNYDTLTLYIFTSHASWCAVGNNW